MAKRPGSPDPPPVASVNLTPAFKLVFITVVCLSILSLVASIALVLYGPRTEDAKRLIETCSTTWKLGFGAVVGLIGGKAL
jgi:hypothetical protein